MRSFGDFRILRRRQVNCFAIQHASLNRRSAGRLSKSYPTLFFARFEDRSVERVNQHVIGYRTRVVTGQYYDVIEDQAVLSQFTGSFPALTHQAALQNLSRCLAGRDLNRTVH